MSRLMGLRCIKLQKPPRVHSDISYCRQHASRKSVTYETTTAMVKGWTVKGWKVKGWKVKGWMVKGWMVKGWMVKG